MVVGVRLVVEDRVIHAGGVPGAILGAPGVGEMVVGVRLVVDDRVIHITCRTPTMHDVV